MVTDMGVVLKIKTTFKLSYADLTHPVVLVSALVPALASGQGAWRTATATGVPYVLLLLLL